MGLGGGRFGPWLRLIIDPAYITTLQGHNMSQGIYLHRHGHEAPSVLDLDRHARARHALAPPASPLGADMGRDSSM